MSSVRASSPRPQSINLNDLQPLQPHTPTSSAVDGTPAEQRTSTSTPPDTNSRGRLDAHMRRTSAAGDDLSIHSVAARSHAQVSGTEMPATGAEASSNVQSSILRRRQISQHVWQVDRDLKSALRAEAKVRNMSVQCHQLLGEGVGDPETSYAAGELDNENIKLIRDLEDSMRSSPEAKMAMEALLKNMKEVDKKHGHCPPLEKATRTLKGWGDWMKDHIGPEAASALGWAAIGVGLGKSAAWYGPRKAIPFVGAFYKSLRAMVTFIAKRYGIADPTAMFLEYIPTVKSQKMWARSGKSMTGWQGFAGVMDGVGTGFSLGMTGAFQLRERVIIGLTTVANTIQSGVVSDLWALRRDQKAVWEEMAAFPLERMERERRALASTSANVTTQENTGEEVDGDAIETAPENAVVAVAPQHEEADMEVNDRALPAKKDSRRMAKTIGRLENSFPDAGVITKKMEKYLDSIQKLENSSQALLEFIAGMSDSERQEFGSDLINEMQAPLERAKVKMQTLAEKHEDEDTGKQLTKLDNVLKAMTAAKEKLEKHGGRDPETMALLGGMTALFTGLLGTGLFATNLSLPVRGALVTLSSVPGQTLGNAASYIFKDNPNRGQFAQDAIAWARASGIISVSEFPWLQGGIGILDAAQSDDLAGKVPEAPANHPLTVPVTRGLQEFAKSIAGPGINKIMKGENLRPHHYVGAGLNAATQVAGIVWALKEKKEKQD